ncbi:MAG: DUF2029 domain-containing protein [Anaerolineae bacterium]|nr:DUF2029 domain-containing protein [Anaerolineae bacterium]
MAASLDDSPYAEARWRQPGLLLAALLMHVGLLALLYFGPGYRADLSTIPFDFTRGTQLLSGKLIYRDYPFEYPPLGALWYALPRLVAQDTATYHAAFAVQMAVVDLATVVLVWAWARRMGQRVGPPLMAQALFLLAAGVMIVLERFDLVAAGLTALALYLWPKTGGVWGWACLALGAGVKIFPAAIAPLWIVEQARRRQWGSLFIGLLIFAVTLAVPFVPLLIIAPDSLGKLLAYHQERGVQIESLLATPLLIGHAFGATVKSQFAFGSQEINSALTPTVAALATPLVILALALVTWRYARGPLDEERRLRFALAAILAFTLFNKVLSAQYMIWPYTLAPLVTTRRRLAWGLYAAALALTQYLYPHGWNSLTGLDPQAIAVQAGRNTLLLLAWALLLWEPRQTARRVEEAGAASALGPVVGAEATSAGSGSSGWARRAR